MLIFVIFALRFTGQGMISHLAIVGTARWFVATRGRALVGRQHGICGRAGDSAGCLRGTSGGDAVALALGYCCRLWRCRRPRHMLVAAQRTHAAIGGRGFSCRRHERASLAARRELLRHWLFWLMVPTLLGPAAWGTALFFQQVHLAEVKGWTHVEFVALFPLFTAVSIASTFASGWALDKVGTNRLMPFYLLPFVARLPDAVAGRKPVRCGDCDDGSGPRASAQVQLCRGHSGPSISAPATSAASRRWLRRSWSWALPSAPASPAG